MKRLLLQTLLRIKLYVLCHIGITALLLTVLITSAIPVSAGTLAWSVFPTPGIKNCQLVANNDIDLFKIAPDGADMFAYDNTAHLLYKSNNSGTTWTTDSIGTGLEPNVATAMAVSPDYANDKIVVAASGRKVYRSIDGGINFYDISLNISSLLALTEVITSIDYSPRHLGYQTIIIGTSNVPLGGHACLLGGLSSAWSDLDIGNWSSPKVACNVLALAFSPNNQSDNGIMAVVTYSGGTMLTSKNGNNTWGADIINTNIFTQQAGTATLAFPADFEWSSLHYVLVGTSGTTADDVFLVNAGVVGGTSSVYDLNAGGTFETEVNSIAVKGALSQAKVLVGQKASPVILYASDISYSVASWNTSSKSPTGSANTIVAWSPTSNNAYAATSGIGSALSRSTDYGATWNQISLIDISNAAFLSITDIAAVDEKTVFIIMLDNTDNSTAAGIPTITPNDYTMLFLTIDGGLTWEQVWTHRTLTTEAMTMLKLSPAYAKDKTLFIAQNDSTLWVTTDDGISFTSLHAPTPVTALGVVDHNTYYTGHENAIYKNNRWTPATLDGTVKSIVITQDGSTIFAGTNDGNVSISTDGAKTFTLLSTSPSLGDTADIIVALDYNYAASKTIFAASPNVGGGIKRWVVGQSVIWQQIDPTDSSRSYSGLAVSSEDVLYAASNTMDKGLRRIISPNAEQTYLNPESVTIDLPAGAKLNQLAVVPGSNTIMAVASNVAPGDYGYPYRLLSFSDILAVAPEVIDPPDKAIVSDTFTLVWKRIESPSVLTYRYQVATDPSFTDRTMDNITTGSSINVRNLRPGGQYWWRVYVEKVGNTPLRSKTSAVRTFSVELPAPVIKSPDYGATDVSLRPSFSWLLVQGASYYEVELADNLNYRNAWVQNNLSHTVWTWEKDLKNSTSYYWRARAVVSRDITSSYPGQWSEAVFTTRAKAATPIPPVIVDTLKPPPPPVIILAPMTVDIPSPPVPPPSNISPSQAKLIMVIYSVLVLAIVVLIAISRGMRLF